MRPFRRRTGTRAQCCWLNSPDWSVSSGHSNGATGGCRWVTDERICIERGHERTSQYSAAMSMSTNRHYGYGLGAFLVCADTGALHTSCALKCSRHFHLIREGLGQLDYFERLAKVMPNLDRPPTRARPDATRVTINHDCGLSWPGLLRRSFRN